MLFRSIRAVSPYTPTRQWSDVLWAAVAGAPWRASHWLLLAAYAAGFGALATIGFARDELQRFR